MTEKMIMVPEIVLKIATTSGFMACYREMCKRKGKKVDAYEAVEELHEKYYGKRKYSEYASFRVIISRCHR